MARSAEMTPKSLTKENADGLLFFKEVAKYFMDFLEGRGLDPTRP